MESPWLQIRYSSTTSSPISSRTPSTAWKVWLSAWLAKISASECSGHPQKAGSGLFYLRVQCIQICQPDSKECKLMSAPTLCIEKGLIEKNKPGTGSTNDKPTFLVKNPRESMPNSSKSCSILHVTLGVPGSIDWPLRNAIGHWKEVLLHNELQRSNWSIARKAFSDIWPSKKVHDMGFRCRLRHRLTLHFVLQHVSTTTNIHNRRTMYCAHACIISWRSLQFSSKSKCQVRSPSVSQSTFLPCLFGATTTNDKANPASMKITSKYCIPTSKKQMPFANLNWS